MTARRTPRFPLWFAGAAAVVLVLGAWARVKGHGFVLEGGRVVPLEGDGAYHLHRIVALSQDPSYPGVFDSMTNWPNGAVSLWAPGFDWVAVGFAWLLGGGGDPARAAQVAAFFPVVLGIRVIVAVMTLGGWLGRRDPVASTTAGLFIAWMPQSVAIASVGRVDHHVSEALSVALLMMWTLWVGEEEGTAKGRRAVVKEVVGTIIIAGSIWMMTVALVYVALAAIGLGMMRLARAGAAAKGGAGGPAGAYAFVAAAVLLGVAYAPIVAAHGQTFSYAFPSYFQPTCTLIAGVFVFGAGWAAARRVPGSGAGAWGRRAAWAMAPPIAVTLVLMVVAPGLRQALARGITEYGGSGDAWLARIDEIRPLFEGGAGRARSYLGTSLWIAPLAVGCGLHLAIKRDRASGVSLAMWVLTLGLLSIAQNRWLRGFLVPLSVVAGIAFAGLARETARRWDTTRRNRALRRRFVPGFAGGLALIFLLGEDAEAVLVARDTRAHVSLRGVGDFLRAYRAPDEGDRTAVLAEWDLGQELLFISGRPILSGGFGPFTGKDGFDAEQEAWAAPRARLVEILDERRARYVVVGAETFYKNVPGPDVGPPFMAGPDGRGGINAPYFQRVENASLILGGTGIPELGVVHHARLAPIYASAETVVDSGGPLPAQWVYERVEGAVLVGRASPRTPVVAEIFLRHAGGDLPYRGLAVADAEGRFALRFPIWTRRKESTLQSSKSVLVHRKGFLSLRVDVTEAQVRSGEEIAVADAPTGDQALPSPE